MAHLRRDVSRALALAAGVVVSIAALAQCAPGYEDSAETVADAGGPSTEDTPGAGRTTKKARKVSKEEPQKADRSKGSKKHEASPKKSAPTKKEHIGGARNPATVTDVVDGDTIYVTTAFGPKSVRLIGVDTPETVHPTEPVECFGPRASSFTTDALLGERVRLEFDDERRDHYGRLLAYVWLNGHLFNKRLVSLGYAEVMIYSPNDAHADALYAAQARAQDADRGLWNACSNPAPVKAPKEPKAGGGACDPNYKGACIPEYPPDIDCPDAGAVNFRSVGSDPHGFDGDGDGIACEG